VRLWLAGPPTGFEVVSTVTGEACDPGGHLRLLREIPVACRHRDGRVRTVEDCARCQRLAGLEIGPGAHEIAVRCVTRDGDPVGQHTQAWRASWMFPAATPPANARAHVRADGAPCAFLIERGTLRAVVDADPGTADDAPAAEPVAVFHRAPLRVAIDALRRLARPSVLVIDTQGDVLGVLTRERLIGLGVPRSLLE
jgi:hypothetical protein